MVALACVWEFLSRTGIVNPLFLPPFSVVIADVYHGFVTGYLGQHVVASLGRAVPGLLLALLVGVPLGLALDVRGHREWNYWETGITWDQRGFDGTKSLGKPLGSA